MARAAWAGLRGQACVGRKIRSEKKTAGRYINVLIFGPILVKSDPVAFWGLEKGGVRTCRVKLLAGVRALLFLVATAALEGLRQSEPSYF